MARAIAVVAMAVCLLAGIASAQQLPPEVIEMRSSAERVTFPAEGRTLMGWLYEPRGAGPFPAVIFNHGSDKNPIMYAELAIFYVGHGYAFFVPVRHGHGQSPGDYIVDLEKNASGQERMALQELYNLDVVAAIDWIRKRPRINPDQLIVTGVSYGGIQTLLTAEKGLGVRAFVPFAPGAMSWSFPAVGARELEAVKNAKAPVFLLQAANDFSTGPSELLGPVLRDKGGSRAKLYPAFGSTPADGHGGFAGTTPGIARWGADVLDFLTAAGVPPPKP